jgi:hypothetical protein
MHALAHNCCLAWRDNICRAIQRVGEGPLRLDIGDLLSHAGSETLCLRDKYAEPCMLWRMALLCLAREDVLSHAGSA